MKGMFKYFFNHRKRSQAFKLNIDQFSKEFDAYTYYRVNGEGECKDVTVGDCELKADQIVFSSIISDAGLCQFFCNTLTDCNVFQFHEAEQNCTLLKEDYHQDCLSSSGPEVRNIVKEVSTYQKVFQFKYHCNLLGIKISKSILG